MKNILKYLFPKISLNQNLWEGTWNLPFENAGKGFGKEAGRGKLEPRGKLSH